MSTRYNNGSHYENHQRAAELHDLAAHAHRVGEQHGKQDHLTGHEHARQAFEHSQEAHRHTQEAVGKQGATSIAHEEIAALAYKLWHERGCPAGSPDEDWHRAAKQLRTEAD
jgi:Protein of unknown function (DUF2934)